MRFSTCSLLAAAVAGAIGCGSDISYPVERSEDFIATLNGTNESPVVTTPATGTAYISIIDDTILTFRVNVAAIDSTTLSHIHLGGAGVNGSVLVTLFNGASVACKNSSGTLINIGAPRCTVGYAGPLNQSQAKYSGLPGTTAAYTALGTTARARFDSLVVLLRNGGAYVNVHNVANGGGHIRGQVGPR